MDNWYYIPDENGNNDIYQADGRRVASAVSHEVAQAIVADHNNGEVRGGTIVRLTAQRNRYWEQVEVLVEALRNVAIHSLRYCEEKYGHDDQARLNLEAILAAVAEESES